MSRVIYLLGICLGVLISCTQMQSQMNPMDRPAYALAIHGGAGTIDRDKMSLEMEKAYREALQLALSTGEEILAKGGSALDAIEATIHTLEDNPLFNAGKGAVFTHDEEVELDASFMDGKTMNAGAIAGAKRIRNPISAARLVMDSSAHVLLSGKGADEFGQNMGLEMVENSYFHTQRRLEQVRSRKAKGNAMRSPQDELDLLKSKYGTVGAVALDQEGNLAAGTSTGGMTNKRFGRIGDSPLIGAGTYANNQTCAVSCTGHGEFFIRNVVSFDVSARMLYKGESLEKSANGIIADLKSQGGTGGLIAIDAQGNVAMPFNTSGMYRGYITSKGDSYIGIYEKE